jgi:ankyrin repeat protein
VLSCQQALPPRGASGGGRGGASKVEQLLDAARRGDISALRGVMTGPQRPPIDAPDPVTLRTPLMEAVGLGHAPVVQSLLSRKANVDLKDREGRTALMLAASSGSSQIVGFLLQKNPRVNTKDKDGWTALMHAASGDYRFVVEALLGHPKIVRQIKNHRGQTASDLTTCPTTKSMLQVSTCRWFPETPPVNPRASQDPPPVANGQAPSAPLPDPNPPPPPPQAQVGGTLLDITRREGHFLSTWLLSVGLAG